VDGTKRFHKVQVKGTGLTTRDAFGTDGTVLGAATAFSDSTGQYINYATTTTSGTQGGLFTSTIQTTQFLPDAYLVMKTGAVAADITGVRIIFGWSSTFTFDTSDNPASTHLAAFRFSTGAGDTTWRALTKDGTTLNNQDSGVTVAADTKYILRIKVVTTSSIEFYINGTLVATSSSNLPTSTTTLNLYMGVATNTTAGTARALRFNSFQAVST